MVGKRFKFASFDWGSMRQLRAIDEDTKCSREDLFDQVREGLITPDQAELIASERGLGSLTSPEWTGPDVLEHTVWSIEMTMAWSIWREREAVQWFYEPYRTRCFEWCHVLLDSKKSGYKAGRLKPANFLDVKAKAGVLPVSPDSRLV